MRTYHRIQFVPYSRADITEQLLQQQAKTLKLIFINMASKDAIWFQDPFKNIRRFIIMESQEEWR